MKSPRPLAFAGLRVCVLVPCFNEELTVARVVTDFQRALPTATVHVFDNNSTDRTAEVALAHGAHVSHVLLKGKGNVVRRMFADVEADVYVMVDGDATYDAGTAGPMIDKLIRERLDMVVGCRVETGTAADAYRRGHRLGNRLLTQSVRSIFGGGFSDMLSGYRVFSRRYVKSFPALARGFETETELTVHALELRMPFGELPTPYGARPDGSTSKLATYKDGFRILRTITKLFVSERPLFFFGLAAAALALSSVLLVIPILVEFWETGLVRRFPTLMLVTALMLAGIVSLGCGLILDTVTRGRQEVKRLIYLSVSGDGHKAT
jgi:glycosyltransferase involved in cell wall biosynthesis